MLTIYIDTKEKMFSWISANLDTTDFTSISEAVSKWEEIENIATIDFQNNIEYYTEVTNNKSRFFFVENTGFEPVTF